MSLLLGALLAACAAPDPAGPPEDANPGWDPVTGRGAIAWTTPAGQRHELRLQDGFEGYAGGLLLGGLDGSAWRTWPVGSDPAGEGLALWCAQDESLLLEEPGGPVEFAHGWSENFGTGPDGVPLRYLGGRVLAEDEEGLLLFAENAALPFQLARWLLLLPDATLLTRLRVANASAAPLRFSFWEGEDPWVGAWGSSAGDAGWVAGEAGGAWQLAAGVPAGAPRCLGIADLDPAAAAPRALGANALCLAPGAPEPAVRLFAEGFAHDPAEIAPGTRARAFNLGWTGIALAPGEAWEISWAMGAASVPDPAAPPVPPAIPTEAWARLAALPAPEPSAERVGDPLSFTEEEVVLEVLPPGDAVQVRGRYTFANASDRDLERRIFFPFAVDEAHPFPQRIQVEGQPHRRLREGVVFSVRVPAGGETDLALSYRQEARDGSATYVVTSARAWQRPLARADLSLLLPPGIDLVEGSYPLEPGEPGTWRGRFEPFQPEHEWTVRWAASRGGAPELR